MRRGNVALIVVGSLLALVGLVAAIAGGTLIWAHATQRDAAGYYTTSTHRVATQGYALVGSADFGSPTTQHDWVPLHPAGTVRIRAWSPAGGDIFVGIAPRSEVDTWLRGVALGRMASFPAGVLDAHVTDIPGTAQPGPPGRQHFWVAQSSGAGQRTLVWPSEAGQWSAVIMNATGAPAVVADVNEGLRTGLLLPVGLGVLGFGVLVLAAAATMLVTGLRQDGDRRYAPVGGPVGAGGPVAPGSYPVRLDGHVDPTASRWLWLVKWILVVPHVIVLSVLWLVVSVLTVVAGFAILFTGRYPRPIFDFNAGVFRWTWRVVFYALGAFATDRYPPFSLAADPWYPADLTIDYPEHLSRPLVLVKWWLLALPQYLIVAIFAGGWGLGWPGSWRVAGGSGLIGLLAIIAAVIRGITGRYPDQLFDLIMGLNRWCYRVLAYAALMRDEYPPFRLDAGGTDPGHRTVRPVPPPPVPPPPAGVTIAPRRW